MIELQMRYSLVYGLKLFFVENTEIPILTIFLELEVISF